MPDVLTRLFLGLLLTLLIAYEAAILLACIFSWFRVSPWGAWGGLVRAVQAVTEPVYAWIGRYLPLRGGALDFTPMLLMFLLEYLRRVVQDLLHSMGGG